MSDKISPEKLRTMIESFDHTAGTMALAGQGLAIFDGNEEIIWAAAHQAPNRLETFQQLQSICETVLDEMDKGELAEADREFLGHETGMVEKVRKALVEPASTTGRLAGKIPFVDIEYGRAGFEWACGQVAGFCRLLDNRQYLTDDSAGLPLPKGVEARDEIARRVV